MLQAVRPGPAHRTSHAGRVPLTFPARELAAAIPVTPYGQPGCAYIRASSRDFNDYFASLEPHQRFVDKKLADEGVDSLYFAGVPMIPSRSAKQGTFEFLDAGMNVIGSYASNSAGEAHGETK